MRLFRIIFFFLLIFSGRLTAQDAVSFARLNSYEFLVVKAEGNVQFKESVHQRILELLALCNFPKPMDPSVLYSTSFDQSRIITLSYKITNPSNTAGQIICSYKFVNSDYETILSNSVSDKYQIVNEKNYLKSVDKCFAPLLQYKYEYVAPAPTPTLAATTPAAIPPAPAPSKEERGRDEIGVPASRNELGKYYALVIGISNYIDPTIPDLDSLPVKDADRLARTLQQYYTFDKENIRVLKDPLRRDIVIALDELSKKVGPDDNVLIFYGGHGHYENDFGIGYWFPRDAESGNSANWLYNDQLVASLKKIRSRHTLLISDACFSGSIFKTRSVNIGSASEFIKKKYQLKSRKAITSGTLTTVPNESIFMKYLIENLRANTHQFMSGSQLFQSIETPVGNNAPSVPQFGVIQNVGDEGGDFIFIKRN